MNENHLSEEQLDKVLEDILNQWHVATYPKYVNKIFVKLKSTYYKGKANAPNVNSFKICLDVLSNNGYIIKVDSDNQEIFGLISSGAMNMNFTSIFIKIIDDVVYAKTCAKEGLINCKTAQKAVNNFFNLLI